MRNLISENLDSLVRKESKRLLIEKLARRLHYKREKMALKLWR